MRYILRGEIMAQPVAIDLKVFKKNQDGSWTSIQNTDINIPFGIVRIPGGMIFKQGKLNWGVDIAAMLDDTSSKQPA